MVELVREVSPATTASGSAANSPPIKSQGTAKDAVSETNSLLPLLRTLMSVVGIYGCFLTQGVVQETIYSSEIAGAKFRSPLFLVAMVCLVSGAMGFALSTRSKDSRVLEALKNRETVRKNSAMLKEGFLISLSYVGAMACTNFALTRVNYPTQVLVKSAKAVPVILGGFLLYGKRYPVSDYIMVALVTGSLLIFQYGNLKARTSSSASTLSGFIALLFSLTFDGLTGPRQDRVVAQYKLGTGDVMLLINMFATPVCLSVSLLVEGAAPYAQVMDNFGYFVPRILAFVVCGALGQVFIVRVLRSLGSLHLTLITTTRKFFAILISVLWFGHPLSVTQWAAVAMIFSSGFVKYWAKKLPSKSKLS